MPVPPEKVRRLARKGLREREKWLKSGANPPATRVGVERANQLANGENLSISTIKRMISFLERHRKNYKPNIRDSKKRLTKGTVSYLLWGGLSALTWAKSELQKTTNSSR